MDIKVAKCFEPLFKIKNKNFILEGGRASGKSKVVYQLCITLMLNHPKLDWIVARDSYSDLETSSYAELVNYIEENELNHEFQIKKSPLRIVRKGNNGTIYFLGVGGSDKSRTKSYKTKHKVAGIIFEELQQVKDEESLTQALASFRRLLDPNNWRIILVFNPPAQNAHWVNVWSRIKEKDPDYVVIKTSYLDIIDFINDVDLKEILKMKMLDFQKYEWFYLGKPGGGFGSVYPQFKREKHFITYQESINRFSKYRFKALIIGGDGAVTHDCTSLVPIAILENGQALVLDIFHHDPKTSRQLSSAALMPYIKLWFEELNNKYMIKESGIPILFKIDSAATDFRLELGYKFANNRTMVSSFSKSTIVEMVGVVQSAISENCIYIINFGGYKDYVQNKFIQGENPLVIALENLIWNEKMTGYDPIVPNDDSDAFTYAVNTYYKNPDNVNWLKNLKRKEFYDL